MFGTVYLPDLESYWSVIETQTELLRNQQIMMDGLTQQINQLKLALLTISNSLTDKDTIEKESLTVRNEKQLKKNKAKKKYWKPPINIYCFWCEKPNHTQNNCWHRLGLCYICGSADHMLAKCPLNKHRKGPKKRPMYKKKIDSPVVLVSESTDDEDNSKSSPETVNECMIRETSIVKVNEVLNNGIVTELPIENVKEISVDCNESTVL